MTVCHVRVLQRLLFTTARLIMAVVCDKLLRTQRRGTRWRKGRREGGQEGGRELGSEGGREGGRELGQEGGRWDRCFLA